MGKTFKGKAKVKAKIQAAKRKIARKVKGCAALALVALFVCGCMETQPASRATTATYGDIVVKLGEKSHGNTVTITLGDGALASADSAGSTETQTATPSMSIPVRVDARYNDMLSQATEATKKTLSSIGSGLGAVLDMMADGKSGTVAVTKADGTPATVSCENGQCSFCTDNTRGD